MSTWVGTGVDDLVSTADALRDGSWAAAGLHGINASVSTAEAFVDPIGTLVRWGIGNLVEKTQPLSGWLDDLAGEPESLRAQATRVRQIASDVVNLADHAASAPRGDFVRMEGLAAQACRQFGHHARDAAILMGRAIHAAADALQEASRLVEAVRDFIRDLLGEAVASAVKKVMVSGGVLAAGALAAFCADVERKARAARRKIEQLTTSFEALGRLLDRIAEVAGPLRQRLDAYASREPLPLVWEFVLRDVARTAAESAVKAAAGANATQAEQDGAPLPEPEHRRPVMR